MNCADDLVILCKRGKAGEALQRMRDVMSKLKLTVNEEKARICTVPAGEFDFLVYTLGSDVFGAHGTGTFTLPGHRRKADIRLWDKGAAARGKTHPEGAVALWTSHPSDPQSQQGVR